MKKIDRILLIRLSSLGDVLLSTPLIRLLHRKFPSAKIEFVIFSQYAELLRHHPNIHQLYSFKKEEGMRGLSRLIDELKINHYDVILDLHDNFRSRWITARLGGIIRRTPVYRVKKQKFLRFLLVRFKMNLYRKAYGRIIPVWEKYCRTAAKIGIKAEGSSGIPDFFPGKETIESARRLLNSHQIKPPYFTMAPGARHFTKRWPPEGYAAVINQLYRETGIRTILLGGREDQETGAAVIEKTNREALVNLIGKTTISESGVIIGNATLLLTNDSGLMHAGSAVNVPVIAIFGSTVEEFGFFPQNDTAAVVQNSGLYCRPCSHIGRSSCPEDHFRCMREISPALVAGEVLKKLQEKQKG